MSGQFALFEAVKWAFYATWGGKVFFGLFSFILAAILGPREFGIIAISFIYVGFIQMVLDQGLATALIQRKDLQQDHLNSVFWTNIAISIILIGVSVLLSIILADLYKIPELMPVISLLSLSLPLQGLTIVHRALLNRDMNFKTLSIITNTSVVISGAIGISAAYVLHNVWALVAQHLSREILEMLFLWMRNVWRPSRKFSMRHLKQLFAFSSMNFLGQLGVFADAHGVNILLSVFFGPISVGIYRLAERLMSTVISLTQTGFLIVSLPEFSRLQDNPVQLRKSVIACIRMSSIVTMPALAGLAAVSDSLIGLMSPEWEPASNVIKILCLFGMALIFAFLTVPLLQALSKSRYSAALEWARTTVGLLVLLVFAFFLREKDIMWQVIGVAFSRLASGIIVTPLFLVVLLRISKIHFAELVRAVIPSVLSAGAIFTSLFILQKSNLLLGTMHTLILMIQVAIGVIIGISVLICSDTQLRLFLLSFFQGKYEKLQLRP